MKTLILILLVCVSVFLFFWSVAFRCLVLNFHKAIYYFFKDLFKKIKFRDFNVYPDDGKIIAFNGLFGSGKTLSMVKYINRAYKRYNNKIVYDKEMGFVRQYIHIVTNVTIQGIPTLKMKSLQDIVEITKHCRESELKNHCREVFICAIDEAVVQMSSRNWKGGVNGKANFNMDFISALMTCRHFHVSFLYTSVRFGLVDSMLRSATSDAIEVYRPFKWRILVQYTYDAWDLENSADKTKLKPIAKRAYWLDDSDFNCYDTLALVEEFVSTAEAGGFFDEMEILQKRGNVLLDPENVQHKSRTFKRSLKAGNKRR